MVDEAFLRRIPYKVEVADPTQKEFHGLFQMYCEKIQCEYKAELVEYLIKTHFLPHGRRMRRCHPRDLLNQIRNFCTYNDLKLELRKEYLDLVVTSYFTTVLNQSAPA